MDKIAIGIVTYNRPTFVKRLVESISPDWYDRLVIINDGDHVEGLDKYEVIKNETNLGVCKSKNKALNILMSEIGFCNDYIFLIEDDMLLDGNVFEKYIEAHKKTGIHHFSFAYHGDYNKNDGEPNPVKIIDYGDLKITLNRHSVGAFSFFTRESILQTGFFDEKYSRFNNAFDHVDHSYRLAEKGYSTPYWWWADIYESWKYIKEQGDADENSTIRNNPEWFNNVKNAAEYFQLKHGYMPAWNECVPMKPLDEVIEFLKRMKQ